MKVRPLIIGPEQDARIAEIVAYAKGHVLPLNELTRMSREQNDAEAIGNNNNTSMEFPFGYRVVYSQEEQPVHGVCHHISISVDEEPTPKPPAKVLPSEAAVNMIMAAFGMKTTVMGALFIYTEDLEYGGGKAINIIEPVERRTNGPGPQKPAN